MHESFLDKVWAILPYVAVLNALRLVSYDVNKAI